MTGRAADRRDLGAFIPSHLDDAGLDPYTFRIYCRVVRRAGADGCWESATRMAEACGMSEKRVRQAIDELDDAGYIDRQRRPGRTLLLTLTPVPRTDHPGTTFRGTPVPRTDEGTTSEGTTRKENPARESTTEIVDALAGHVQKITGRRPRTPERTWKGEAIGMLTVDRAPLDEVLDVIAWLDGAEFWRSKVTSVRDLRRHYDKLLAQMRDAGPGWPCPIPYCSLGYGHDGDCDV